MIYEEIFRWEGGGKQGREKEARFSYHFELEALWQGRDRQIEVCEARGKRRK